MRYQSFALLLLALAGNSAAEDDCEWRLEGAAAGRDGYDGGVVTIRSIPQEPCTSATQINTLLVRLGGHMLVPGKPSSLSLSSPLLDLQAPVDGEDGWTFWPGSPYRLRLSEGNEVFSVQYANSATDTSISLHCRAGAQGRPTCQVPAPANTSAEDSDIQAKTELDAPA